MTHDGPDDRMPPEPPRPPPVARALYTIPRTRREVVERAKSLLGRGVKYKMPGGRIMRPDQIPTRGVPMDCSEFACWALGIAKFDRSPLYTSVGGRWRNTSEIHRDGLNRDGIFTRTTRAEPGDLIVYPWRNNSAGHVGIIVTVKDGAPVDVIDCSSWGWRVKGDAIQVRPASVWTSRGAIIVRADWL